MFASISNISMGRSLWVQLPLGSLLIRRSRPLRYRFGKYPVRHGKLNLRHPISASSESRTSVLIAVGVTLESPDHVPSLVWITSIVDSSRVIGRA